MFYLPVLTTIPILGRVVDTQETLTRFLETLRKAEWLAVDTEADSLHAYPEKVCLIQVSTGFGDRIIDPLAGLNLDPFLEELSHHELIMHGADYDLRLLRKHHEFVPKAIFDTMLAARVIGVRQFGLSNLVEQFLGVKLEKGPQKANWAIRPLSERMEKYARNDTHYLKPLSDQLRAELLRLGRLEWHRESCARLIEECSQPPAPDGETVWRLKGSHALSRQGLGVLKALWQWREDEATLANKPPFFVASHELLVSLAEAVSTRQPVDPLLPKHLSERRRGGLKQAISRALAVRPEQHPTVLKSSGRRPSEAEHRRFLELQNRRDQAATRLGIDPTIIASRSVLVELAHNWAENSARLMKWQRELLSA